MNVGRIAWRVLYAPLSLTDPTKNHGLRSIATVLACLTLWAYAGVCGMLLMAFAMHGTPIAEDAAHLIASVLVANIIGALVLMAAIAVHAVGCVVFALLGHTTTPLLARAAGAVLVPTIALGAWYWSVERDYYPALPSDREATAMIGPLDDLYLTAVPLNHETPPAPFLIALHAEGIVELRKPVPPSVPGWRVPVLTSKGEALMASLPPQQRLGGNGAFLLAKARLLRVEKIAANRGRGGGINVTYAWRADLTPLGRRMLTMGCDGRSLVMASDRGCGIVPRYFYPGIGTHDRHVSTLCTRRRGAWSCWPFSWTVN